MFDPSSLRPTAPSRGRNLRIGAAAVVALLAIAVGIVLSIRGREHVPSPITAEGYDRLVSGIRREFGPGRVLSVAAFEEHAVVYLPVDSESARYRSYIYRDGNWQEFSSGSSQFRRFSPTQVSGAVVAAAVADVRGRVEAPTGVYVVVQAPAADGTCVRASASNTFDESAVVKYRCDGTMVDPA